MKHAAIGLGDIHIIYNWTYADQTAREGAAGFYNYDLGKFARQLDDNSIWVLTATTPTWNQVGGATGSIVIITEEDTAPEVSTGTLIFLPNTVIDNGDGTVTIQAALPAWYFRRDAPVNDPDDANDDFDSGSLDGKWVVVAGTEQTLSLFETGGGYYDLSSRSGWLLMQPDYESPIKLRQDYTLADGYSILAAVTISLNCEGESDIDEDDLDCGIALNDTDGDWHSGNWATVHLDSEPNGMRIYMGGTAGGVEGGYSTPPNKPILHIARRFYFRISRVGLYYYPSWSNDGTTWMPGGGQLHSAALTNIWLFAQCSEAIGDPSPIQGFDWVRILPNSLF